MGKNVTTNNTAIVANSELYSILSEFEFSSYGVRGTKWMRFVNNKSNCQFKIFLRLLSNDTLRISIADDFREYVDATGVFETNDVSKIMAFMNIVCF